MMRLKERRKAARGACEDGRAILLAVVVILLLGVGGLMYAYSRQPTEIDDVREETEEAFEAARKFANDQKNEQLKQIDEEIFSIQKRLNELKKRAKAGVSSDYAKFLEKLEERRKAAAAALEDFRTAGLADARQVQQKLDSTLADLRKDYQEALARFPAPRRDAGDSQAGGGDEGSGQEAAGGAPDSQ